MKTVLSEVDKILVGIGRYPGRKELIEDALRALIRSKPELRMDVAIELYRKREVSISRAAEICGLNIEDFKELLKSRGIRISVPSIPVREIDDEVSGINTENSSFEQGICGRIWKISTKPGFG